MGCRHMQFVIATVAQLGCELKQPRLIADIDRAAYFET
jgi:hypothetical protein